VRSSAVVNHFYIYAMDADFGPFFVKFASYFPYTAKLCINGNEWAKRQAAKASIGFEALDSGFATCEDPGREHRRTNRGFGNVVTGRRSIAGTARRRGPALSMIALHLQCGT